MLPPICRLDRCHGPVLGGNDGAVQELCLSESDLAAEVGGFVDDNRAACDRFVDMIADARAAIRAELTSTNV